MQRARNTVVLFVAALTCAGLVALPRTAHATPGFPGEIQSHLGLAAQPPSSCSLCHTNSAGGKGTVNTPFGVSVRGHGAVQNDNAALDSALDAMAKDGTDSDGDKVPDITELRNGTNPNANDVTVTTNDAGQTVITEGGTGQPGTGNGDTPPPPEYGCATASSGKNEVSTDVPVAFGLVTLTMMLARSTMRRRRRSG